MIDKRVSLSRDHYASGVVTIGASGAKILFTPLTGGYPTAAPSGSPGDAAYAIHADRIFVSNPGTNPIYVLPVIPGVAGQASVQEYPMPAFPGARGTSGANSQWSAFSPAAFPNAPTSSTGITIPAGAVAFPIEVTCIGLVVGGTLNDTLFFAAYGTHKRA